MVDTATAWKQYSPIQPNFDDSIVAPQRTAFAAAYAQQYAALEERIDAHIEKTYLVPLQMEPEGRPKAAFIGVNVNSFYWIEE